MEICVTTLSIIMLKEAKYKVVQEGSPPIYREIGMSVDG